MILDHSFYTFLNSFRPLANFHVLSTQFCKQSDEPINMCEKTSKKKKKIKQLILKMLNMNKRLT